MTSYEYSCASCGVFEVTRPMGAAHPTEECFGCGAAAWRSFAAPALYRTSRPVAESIERAERSQDHPEVVRIVPSSTVGRR